MTQPTKEDIDGLNAIVKSVGVVDFSDRSRLCLVGEDRARFLHGQVTNDIKGLDDGSGCYSAITSAKGKFQADANIFALADEIFLDMEPGLGPVVTERLEHYIVSDDVEVVDVTDSHHMMCSVGPMASAHIQGLVGVAVDEVPVWGSLSLTESPWGELYLFRRPLYRRDAFFLLISAEETESYKAAASEAARGMGGRMVSGLALEAARIEAGSPRFGVDFRESHLVPEAGIEGAAVSYRKGCYIGQETLNRIRAIGRVNKRLTGFEWTDVNGAAPPIGAKVLDGEKAVGELTSVLKSWRLDRPIAMGYAKRDYWEPGTRLRWYEESVGTGELTVVRMPFDPALEQSAKAD